MIDSVSLSFPLKIFNNVTIYNPDNGFKILGDFVPLYHMKTNTICRKKTTYRKISFKFPAVPTC
jgi:hypothetical protein